MTHMDRDDPPDDPVVHPSVEELLKLVDRLREQVDFYKEVSNVLAYEVRHGLAVVPRAASVYAQLLRRLFQSQLTDEQNQLFQHIQDASARSHRMLTALSDYHYALASPATPLDTSIDAEAAIRTVLLDSRIQELVATTGGQLFQTNLPTVAVDEVSLVTIFYHLIVNALTFHRDNVPPIINVSGQEDGRESIVSVSDNGSGFDPYYCQIVFHPFKSLKHEERTAAGMGLAICKAIVTLRGGRLWCESIPGEGSTFYFSFPKD